MMYFAFMHKGRYFLLPPDCPDTDTLLEIYGDGTPFTATELIEEKCLAPCFVSEHSEDVVLALDSERGVYPCMVELFSMDEYNERLGEVVDVKCPGCPRFIDNDDPSLDGHHEEITLDGTCFLREQAEDKDGDHYYIDRWLRRFVDLFGTLELEEMIDKGECSEAEDIFVQNLAKTAYSPVPPIWMGKDDDGKYYVFCTAFLQEHDSILMDVLFSLLTERYAEKWRFFNHIPRGGRINEARMPLGVKYTRDNERISMTVYTEPGKESAAYLWFASQCGEPDLMRICTGYESTEVTDDDPLPDGCTGAAAFVNLVKELAAIYSDKQNIFPKRSVFPAYKSFVSLSKPMPGFADDIAEVEPRLLFNSVRALYYYHDFVLPILHGCAPKDIWQKDEDSMNSITADINIPIARIRLFDPPIEDYDLENASEQFDQFVSGAQECIGALYDSLLFCPFAHTIDRYSVDVFGFVFNLTNLLYTVRRLSPMFTGTNAQLYVYTKSHKHGGQYAVGFDMKQIATEEDLWQSMME